MSRTLAILAVARRLIRQGWTQRRFAADADGNSTGISSDTACKFCVVGALYRAAEDLGLPRSEMLDARVRMLAILNVPTLGLWNDDAWRTQAEVVQLLDTVIKEVEDE